MKLSEVLAKLIEQDFQLDGETDYKRISAFMQMHDVRPVNAHVWTQWKEDLLNELYINAKSMLQEQISGEEFITNKSDHAYSHHLYDKDSNFIEHLDQINEMSYVLNFSHDEIEQHIKEIQEGSKVSVFIKAMRPLLI